MLILNELKIECKFADDINMSNFPENFFRGVFGKYITSYNESLFKPENNAINNLSFLKNKTPSKPYFFNNNFKTIYKKDEIMQLELILLGEYIEKKELFLKVLEKIGNDGLGIKKINYKIENIKILNQEFKPLKFNTTLDKNNVNLKFKTATAIKSKGKITDNFDFSDIVSRFFERYTSILYNWCNQKEVIDYREFIEEAKQIEIYNKNLKLKKYKRTTGHKTSTYTLQGYTGNINLKGENLYKFKNLFEIMQKIKLGKYIDWGYGTILADF